MRNPAFERILSLSSREIELQDTVQYLSAQFEPIVKKGEAVLICFPHNQKTDLGYLAEQAVLKCGGKPVFWDQDVRWITLLRLAFLSKASTIIAPPLVILGLSKLAAYKGVPLYLVNAILAGYPCLEWMIDGIEAGLDCHTWGIFGPGTVSLATGFSCSCGRGVHVRDNQYKVEIEDDAGNILPDGQYGHIILSHKEEPSARFITRAYGQLLPNSCPCGNPSPRIVGIDVGDHDAFSLLKLAESLLYWNSILDCRLTRSESGLEMEIVCFAGEKMPKLPSCARLILRDWDPEHDIPLSLSAGWINP